MTDSGNSSVLGPSLAFIIDDLKEYAFILFSTDARIRSWNTGAERLFGYTEQEALGMLGHVLFTPEDVAARAPEQEIGTAARHGRASDDRWHVRKDGTRFWSNGIMRAIRDEHGALQGFLKILRDLTSQKRAEDALAQSEERFRLFVEHVTDYALIQTDANGYITTWNPGAQRMMGYTEDEIVGHPFSRLFTQEDRDAGYGHDELERTLRAGRTEEERTLVRSDGSPFWATWVTTAIRGSRDELRGFAKVMRDETERRTAEDRLRASLSEKETLLREIHHRVKNNLQVIVSLLSLQADRVDDPLVVGMFDETRHRVQVIASIHESLYSSTDLASIDFGRYMRQLLRDLASLHAADKTGISTSVAADDVVLDIAQAIPLGLIVNELVTNCFKHAFRDRVAGGRIRVSLRYLRSPDEPAAIDDGTAELAVEDNGCGLPDPRQFEHPGSMGLLLVKLLTAQLRGKLRVTAERGTAVRIEFPLTLP